MMKKRRFNPVLALTVVAAAVLLGAAVWYAVLRPQSNWHPVGIHLPDHRPPDCWVSAFFLFLTAHVCFTGGVFCDEVQRPKDGGDGACP